MVFEFSPAFFKYLPQDVFLVFNSFVFKPQQYYSSNGFSQVINKLPKAFVVSHKDSALLCSSFHYFRISGAPHNVSNVGRIKAKRFQKLVHFPASAFIHQELRQLTHSAVRGNTCSASINCDAYSRAAWMSFLVSCG